MPEVSVRMAEGPADFEAARTLCREWVDWQLRTFPERRDVILKVFEPEAYARTLAALPEIHARPLGGILLADIDGRSVGCVMYLEQAPGVAEIKRLCGRVIWVHKGRVQADGSPESVIEAYGKK